MKSSHSQDKEPGSLYLNVNVWKDHWGKSKPEEWSDDQVEGCSELETDAGGLLPTTKLIGFDSCEASKDGHEMTPVCEVIGIVNKSVKGESDTNHHALW
jgi:hypothetical protein